MITTITNIAWAITAGIFFGLWLSEIEKNRQLTEHVNDLEKAVQFYLNEIRGK